MGRRIKLFMYFFAKYLGLFRLAKFLTRNDLRIICYHGGNILDENKYNGLLFMSKRTFSNRVNWLLSNKFKVVSLNEALEFNSMKNSDSVSVVITFDDGWYSTGSELLPVLIEEKLPSVLYLSTKQYELQCPVINVVLHYIKWKSCRTTVKILEVSQEIDGEYDFSNNQSVNDLAKKLWLFALKSDPDEVVDALEKIAGCCGVSREVLALASRRFDFLNRTELQYLLRNLCAIELHGHIHEYPLGQSEIFKKDLELCLQTIVANDFSLPSHYCYPSGQFDTGAATVLEELKIASATTCFPGLISRDDLNNKYYLPRFLDGEGISMLEFEAELMGFAELARRFVRRLKRS